MSAEERRQFFRVEDEAEISFKVMSTDETQEWLESRDKADHARKSQLENEILSAITKLKPAQPEVARVLDLLNKKINILGQMEEHELTFVENDTISTVNLSACGIAFPTDKLVKEDQILLLQMRLLPSNAKVTVLSKVIHTENDAASGKQVVRASFENIDSATQDLLMQHLFQVQVRNKQDD